MGSYNGTCGGPHCRAATASDRTTDDSTSHCAAPCGALCHDIRYGHAKRYGHGEPQCQQN